MTFHEIILILFVKRRSKEDGSVQKLGGLGHGIPEESGNPPGHVDPGPFEFGERNDFEVFHIAASPLPQGFETEEIEKLRDALSMASHIGPGPEDHADIFRILSFVRDILGNHLIGEILRQLPGCFCGKEPWIKAIEIDGRRKDGWPRHGRRSRGPGTDVMTRKAIFSMNHFLLRAGKLFFQFSAYKGKKDFQLFLPLFRRRKDRFMMENTGNGRFGEIFFHEKGNHFFFFLLRPGQKFAAREAAGVNISCLFLHFLRRNPVKLSPEVREGGNISLGELKEPPQGIRQGFSRRHLSQHMKAHMGLAVPYFLNKLMETAHIIAEIIGQRHVRIQVQLHGQLPDVLFRGLFLSLPGFAEMGIFVKEPFQVCQFFVSPRFGHGRGQVTHEAGAPPPFGLDPFSHNGHVVEIQIRQVPQGELRIAFPVQAHALPREPFQISMGAHMDDHIRLPSIPQPLIKSQVLMGGRHIGIVVQFPRVQAIAPCRLDGEENMTVHGSGDENISILHHDRPRRPAPVLFQLCFHFLRKMMVAFEIFGDRQLFTLFHLLIRQHVHIVRGMGSHLPDELCPVLRNPGNVIAFLFHAEEKLLDAFHGIQAHGASDI